MNTYNKYLKFTNASQYHKKGFKGQGIKILVAERSLEGTHDDRSLLTTKLYAPYSYSEVFTFTPYTVDELADKAINENFSIVSMSISNDSKPNTLAYDNFNEAFERMLDNGINVVIAAGNYGKDGVRSSAKHDPRLIVVGAVEDGLKRASYSSYDDLGTVDCCGLVNIKQYDNGYGGLTYFTGTSEATPMVAGLIATRLSYDRNTDIQKMIEEYSADVELDGRDNMTGHGVLTLPKLWGNRLAILMKYFNKPMYVHRKYVGDAVKKGYKIGG